jgi:hypothetical protein
MELIVRPDLADVIDDRPDIIRTNRRRSLRGLERATKRT